MKSKNDKDKQKEFYNDTIVELTGINKEFQEINKELESSSNKLDLLDLLEYKLDLKKQKNDLDKKIEAAQNQFTELGEQIQANLNNLKAKLLHIKEFFKSHIENTKDLKKDLNNRVFDNFSENHKNIIDYDLKMILGQILFVRDAISKENEAAKKQFNQLDNQYTSLEKDSQKEKERIDEKVKIIYKLVEIKDIKEGIKKIQSSKVTEGKSKLDDAQIKNTNKYYTQYRNCIKDINQFIKTLNKLDPNNKDLNIDFKEIAQDLKNIRRGIDKLKSNIPLSQRSWELIFKPMINLMDKIFNKYAKAMGLLGVIKQNSRSNNIPLTVN